MFENSLPPPERSPFRYVLVENVLPVVVAEAVLSWFENSAPWQLIIADFYEQYEFSLLHADLPDTCFTLCSKESLSLLGVAVETSFGVSLGKSVDVTAHKLLPGQRIRIHNDFIQGRETHRLLIQFNRSWKIEKGGILLLFNSANPADFHRGIRPIHNSGMLFEISPNSFHAVSPVMEGERYTVVYSFYAARE